MSTPTCPTAQPGHTPHLDYVDLLHRFWRRHADQQFSMSAVCLYVFLLEACARHQWQNPFALADASLPLQLGGSINTWKKARAELLERHLLGFQPGGNGRHDCGVYILHREPEPALPQALRP